MYKQIPFAQFIQSLSLIALLVSPAYSLELSELVASDVQKVDDGFQFIEGPVWHTDGYLLFSDIPANRIYQFTPGQNSTVFRRDSGKSNGLTFDREGRLIACEHQNRRVSRTGPDGTIITIADTWQGKKFNSPNDCTVRSDGMIFFTDPDWGLGNRTREIDFNGVYAVMPGQDPILLVDDFIKPNGICLSPDESILYVADDTADRVRKFSVNPDGSVTNGELFIRTDNPDGIKCDTQGNLYVTSKEKSGSAKGSVVVYQPDGSKIGRILCPEKPANCAFGGPENKTLYMTSGKGLYKVEVTIPGVAVWPESCTQGQRLK